MIYYCKAGDQEFRLEVITDSTGNTTVKLPDGREWAVDFTRVIGNKHYSMLVDNKSHVVYMNTREGTDYQVSIDGQPYSISVETERQHRFASLTQASAIESGEIKIKAPMPGLVTIVGVKPGDQVEQGQRIIVLEAMKMENELKAPRQGVIKEILVSAGQTVEQNKVLLILE
jgi:biotin carboxyl carrier protein